LRDVSGVIAPALGVRITRKFGIVRLSMEHLIPNLSKFVPQLRATIMLPGGGHWTQQERATEVNAAMIDFLRGLPT
jgi:pimeloyl-ACP methyl ester carboxylesterase